MPLHFSEDGSFTLPTPFIRALIDLLTTLNAFQTELSTVSDGYLQQMSDNSTNDVVIVDDVFRETLRDCMVKLEQEESGKWRELNKKWNGVAEEVRALKDWEG